MPSQLVPLFRFPVRVPLHLACVLTVLRKAFPNRVRPAPYNCMHWKVSSLLLKLRCCRERAISAHRQSICTPSAQSLALPNMSDPSSSSNSESVRVHHVDINWTVSFEKKTISGSVSLHARVEADTADVLTVDASASTADGIDWSAVTIDGTGCLGRMIAWNMVVCMCCAGIYPDDTALDLQTCVFCEVPWPYSPHPVVYGSFRALGAVCLASIRTLCCCLCVFLAHRCICCRHEGRQPWPARRSCHDRDPGRQAGQGQRIRCHHPLHRW